MLKPYKKDLEYSYTFGVFPTLELLAHRPGDVDSVVVHSRGARNEGVRKLEALCRKLHIHLEENDRLVERLSPRENAYAFGVFRKYRQELDPASHAHVVLVNPSDMGNLGTISRTMLGFGVTDLALVRPAADLFDPRAVRASMGSIFQIRFEYFDTFDTYRARHDARHLFPFMTGASRLLQETAFEPPFSLVFGNESSGLPGDYLQIGDSVRIAHSERIDSLNLPVAAAVAMYEATRAAPPG